MPPKDVTLKEKAITDSIIIASIVKDSILSADQSRNKIVQKCSALVITCDGSFSGYV